MNLHTAVRLGRILELKVLLQRGSDINAKDDLMKQTPLHLAVKFEYLDMVIKLLQHGADVNARDESNMTPLHVARSLEIVKELLERGADINARDHRKQTPLHRALLYYENWELIVRELIDRGADLTVRDANNKTPLHFAMTLGTARAKLLIKLTFVNNYPNIIKVVEFDCNKRSRTYSILSDYEDNCINELLQMKKDRVEHLSLYDLITKQYSASVFRDIQQLNKLMEIVNSSHYLIYNDIIMDRLKPILARAQLFSRISNLQIYTELKDKNYSKVKTKVFLNYDSVCNITDYLSNADMLNWTKAYDSKTS